MYASEIHQFLLFVEEIKLKELKQLERRHIELYLARLDAEGLAATTRRRKLSIIKSFCAWLTGNKIIAEDPAADIIPPRLQWKRPRVLTKEEYHRLLAVVDEPRDLALIQLLLQTGIHLAEAHRLNLNDISLPDISEETGLGQLRILDRPPKSQTVYVNQAASQALRAWMQVRPQVIGESAFFLSRNQDRLSRRQMQRLVGMYMEQAGLDTATIKALRYTFAGHHLVKGTPLKQVCESLGIQPRRSTEPYLAVAESLRAHYMQANAL